MSDCVAEGDPRPIGLGGVSAVAAAREARLGMRGRLRERLRAERAALRRGQASAKAVQDAAAAEPTAPAEGHRATIRSEPPHAPPETSVFEAMVAEAAEPSSADGGEEPREEEALLAAPSDETSLIVAEEPSEDGFAARADGTAATSAAEGSSISPSAGDEDHGTAAEEGVATVGLSATAALEASDTEPSRQVAENADPEGASRERPEDRAVRRLHPPLPGLGPGMLLRLRHLGIERIEQMADADAESLRRALGSVSRLVDVDAWIAAAKLAAAAGRESLGHH